MLQLLPESLRLYHGSGSSTAVEVFVSGRWPVPAVSGHLVLKGPYCQRARTLPASFALQRVGDELWKTTVVDPCFWSPCFPARYRLQTADDRGDRSCFEVALRRSSARGGHFWIDGRRWVFRGVTGRQFSAEQVTRCADEFMGLVVDADALESHVAAVATASGTPLMLELAAEHWRRQLVSAARCPAAQLVVLPNDWAGDRNELELIAPNLLFVGRVSGNDPLPVPTWADGWLVSSDRSVLEAVGQIRPARPTIVIRRGASGPVPEGALGHQARRQCEQLQRDLAPQFDLSGYIVDQRQP